MRGIVELWLSVFTAINKTIRGGYQNWCTKFANYLLNVFILFHSDMDRSGLETFPLHPQNWPYGTKHWLLLVSFHSIGFQSAAYTATMCALKSISHWNMSVDFFSSPSRVTQIINGRCMWHNWTFCLLWLRQNYPISLKHCKEVLGCDASIFLFSFKVSKDVLFQQIILYLSHFRILEIKNCSFSISCK